MRLGSLRLFLRATFLPRKSLRLFRKKRTLSLVDMTEDALICFSSQFHVLGEVLNYCDAPLIQPLFPAVLSIGHLRIEGRSRFFVNRSGRKYQSDAKFHFHVCCSPRSVSDTEIHSHVYSVFAILSHSLRDRQI